MYNHRGVIPGGDVRRSLLATVPMSGQNTHMPFPRWRDAVPDNNHPIDASRATCADDMQVLGRAEPGRRGRHSSNRCLEACALQKRVS